MASSNTDQTALDQLFNAAYTGNTLLLKKFAAQLKSGGETLAETFLRVHNSKKMTALHMAAAGGRTQICKYLIQTLKLDVNLQDGLGKTPVYYATDCDKYPAAEFLLSIGADPNVADRLAGLTPLHYAAMNGSKKLIALLIERGAEIEANATPVGTPLCSAVTYRKKDSVIALLKHKANPNALASQFMTPLGFAITSNSFELMELLLKAGADVNFESCGATPLCSAATNGEAEAVKLVLKYGANPNFTDWSGQTALERCAAMGRHEICKILFPVTNRIPYIKDWTLKGVLKHVTSEKVMLQSEVKKKEYFAYAKSMGEASFKKKDYPEAIHWYSEALKAEPEDAAVLSNRSLCEAKLGNGGIALIYANACIRAKPDWYKAHYRAGAAYTVLKNYVQAADAFSNALRLDPHNKEIQDSLREAVRKQQSSSIPQWQFLPHQL